MISPDCCGKTQHGVKAVEDLPVVHPDLEALQPQGGEGPIDDGGDLRLVADVQGAVADDVDVRLIELPEAAPLGPLSPVDLADLEATEGEGELAVVQRHILGQGDGEVKAEGQVGVSLEKAVDLLLRLAAALGQQDLAGLDEGGVQGGEAVEGVGLPQDGRPSGRTGPAGRGSSSIKPDRVRGCTFAISILLFGMVGGVKQQIRVQGQRLMSGLSVRPAK